MPAEASNYGSGGTRSPSRESPPGTSDGSSMPSSNATGEVAAALIVASAHYTDPKLTKLRSTAADADRLGRVLADSQIGGYRVSVVRDQPSHVVSLAIERFFKNRRRDDRLLLYMSCHGVKDDSGRLSFATTNTQLSYLGSTAVSAEFVREQMDKSDSRRIVLILDCCYSGAFARGTRLKAADRRIEIKERFDGHGRAVLTASSAMEYAFELPGGKTSGNDEPSIYTSVLVKGLETGSADLNQDGIVTVQELADY